MIFLIGPPHSSGAHDSRPPLEGRGPMKVFFQGGAGSADSWTPSPKPLCHRHPTGPHPSGRLWTPAKGDSTKSNFALGARRLHHRLPGRAVRHPGPVAPCGVGALAAQAGLVEPQCLSPFPPSVAAVDDHAWAATAALRVDGREHDVGATARLGQTALVAHQRDAPRALAPAAEAGVAAEASSLLVGARGPFLRAFLAAAPRPGIGDEAI